MARRPSNVRRAGPRWGRLAVLLGAAVFLGLAVSAAYERWWPIGHVHTGSAAAHGATVARFTIRSRFVHRTMNQVAVTPPGGAGGRPLLVFLHGRGRHGEESNADSAFFAALAAEGDRAPAVVFPDGGEHSYWHTRGSGDWSRYVLDEVIPQAARRLHADSRRVAIGGISMGGYGAYEIARRRPSAFCAVGGHSAATWQSGGETAPGAFDDAQDFARHDVIATARARGRTAWGTARLWLDGGTDDPFRAADQTLAAALGTRMHIWPGGHNHDYWAAHYRAYLRFYADALAHCSGTRSG
jgi:S-formylglutathione hydrolase FrmB